MSTHKVINSEVVNDQVDQSKNWSQEMRKSNIWTSSAQNRLALQLKVEAETNDKNTRKVQKGDTLGAIVKALSGNLDWSQSVDYRSSKLAANRKPKVLAKANLIYPDQYVWIENGVIIVADELPSPPKGKNPVVPPVVDDHPDDDPVKPVVPPVVDDKPEDDSVKPVVPPVVDDKPEDDPVKPVVPPVVDDKPEDDPVKPVVPPVVDDKPEDDPVKPVVPPVVDDKPEDNPVKPPETFTPPDWTPELTTRLPRRLNSIPTEDQPILERGINAGPQDRFMFQQFIYNNLPETVADIMAPVKNLSNLPSTIPVYSSLDAEIGSQGRAYSTGGSYGYHYDTQTEIVTSLTYRPIRTVVGLNFREDSPKEIESRDSEEFKMILLNEFSHVVTYGLLDRYMELRLKAEIGRSTVDRLPQREELERELLSGFAHPDVPQGIYDFHAFNELQSDAASFSVYPEFVTGRYGIYGSDPLNPAGYSLNRDFTAFHLSNFLREKGYGSYSQADINQAFKSFKNSVIGQLATPETDRIADQYHFYDPEFIAYIQPKYAAVGKAFYEHIAGKIRALEATA